MTSHVLQIRHAFSHFKSLPAVRVLWHRCQQKQRSYGSREKNNLEQRRTNMPQNPNVQLNGFLKIIRVMSAVNLPKGFKWLDSCSALLASKINCCSRWLFVSRAGIRKQEVSGQAKASGGRGQRLFECNAWDGRQIRFVHVWLKSQRGLGPVCGNVVDVLQGHWEVWICHGWEELFLKETLNMPVWISRLQVKIFRTSCFQPDGQLGKVSLVQFLQRPEKWGAESGSHSPPKSSVVKIICLGRRQWKICAWNLDLEGLSFWLWRTGRKQRKQN